MITLQKYDAIVIGASTAAEVRRERVSRAYRIVQSVTEVRLASGPF